MADRNSCRTCKYRESGDPAYHCYMFKVEPEPLCMKHQDRTPKRVGTIGHVGGRTVMTAALAVILAQQNKDAAGSAAASGEQQPDGAKNG